MANLRLQRLVREFQVSRAIEVFYLRPKEFETVDGNSGHEHVIAEVGGGASRAGT